MLVDHLVSFQTSNTSFDASSSLVGVLYDAVLKLLSDYGALIQDALDPTALVGHVLDVHQSERIVQGHNDNHVGVELHELQVEVPLGCLLKVQDTPGIIKELFFPLIL